MKSLKTWNLQLFADEAEAEDATTATEETTEEQESETGEEQPRFTQDDVEKILDRKFAQWNKQQEKKAAEAKKAAEEAAKLANMTKEEARKAEDDRLREELKELKEKVAISEMKKEARNVIMEKGLNVSDDLLSMLISTDADSTKANIDEFVSLFNKAVAEAVKEKVKGKTPEVGTSAATLSKEDILKIEDRAERQKKISENITLFT